MIASAVLVIRTKENVLVGDGQMRCCPHPVRSLRPHASVSSGDSTTVDIVCTKVSTLSLSSCRELGVMFQRPCKIVAGAGA